MALTLLLFFTSCSFWSKNPYQSVGLKDRHYQIHFHENNWERLKTEYGDISFQHKMTQSLIVANSYCKDFEGVPLSILAANLISDPDVKLKGDEVLSEEKISLKGYEAYKRFMKLDFQGKEVHLMTVTLKVNNCLFDFALIKGAGPPTEKEMADFRFFLDTVTFESLEETKAKAEEE